MAYFRCTTGGSGKGNTLVVTCADDLAGATITCTNGTKTYNKTCPSTSPYEVTFYGLEAGTWTVRTTVDGTTYTTTVVITDYGAELGGFSWRAWVNLSENYTSSDFTDLNELLGTELAVRELMTIHACVDYLAGIAAESADVETIIGNDLCAKWINNRDYALDTLYANTVIKGYMDTADKYFYGEWVITDDTTTPPTWGAKGNVPVMTSATTPYGTAFSSSNYQPYNEYHAFDGNWDATAASMWASYSSGVNEYVGYKFNNPVKVKKAIVHLNSQYGTFVIRASNTPNDQSTYVNVSNIITVPSSPNTQTFEVDVDTNGEYYLSYELIALTHQSGSENSYNVYELQFYGRELSVSVPSMATNTTPYGVASASSAASNHPAYTAFSGKTMSASDDSTYWVPASGGAQKVTYQFTTNIVPKLAKFASQSSRSPQGLVWKVNGSKDDSSYEELGRITLNLSSAITRHIVTIENANNDDYDYLQLEIDGQYAVGELQFYGLDYSEREFEEGTTKKWLYDHGVELETIAISGTGIKGADAIQLTAANAQAVATIDTTDYSLMRGKAGLHASGTNQLICGSGASNFTANNMPNNNSFDVSNVNGSNAVGVKQTANGIFDATEFWLE